MKTKLSFRLLAALLVLFSTSCLDSLKPGWKYLVDNPLDTDIVIQIDQKEYTIPARTTQPISISQGRHTLTYNGSSVDFVTKVNSNKSVTIMNPTLSNYMLHANFYIQRNARNKDIAAVYDENSYEYQSDSGLVKLPVRVLNLLFIDKTHHHWAFGLEDDVKSELSSSYPGKKKVFHKLYRESDYKKEFPEEVAIGVVFPINSKKLSEQPAYVFPAGSFMCDCDALNAFVEDLESRWNKMIADPSNIFQDVAKLSYDVTAEFGQNSKSSQQCSTQFNPGRDDKELKETLSRLSEETRYMSDASTFIVK